MIDVSVLSGVFASLSMLVSLCSWSVRRLRCTGLYCVCRKHCIGERTLMSEEEMVYDKVPPRGVVEVIGRFSLDVRNNHTFV